MSAKKSRSVIYLHTDKVGSLHHSIMYICRLSCYLTLQIRKVEAALQYVITKILNNKIKYLLGI